MISMMVLWLHTNLHLALALSCLVAGSAGVAIADVTIDACVTQCSISHPTLAADMQSLCGLSSSIGSLVGFSLSGLLVHLVGSKVGSLKLSWNSESRNASSVFHSFCPFSWQGVYGLLGVTAGLLVVVGMVLKESPSRSLGCKHVRFCYPLVQPDSLS